MSIKCRPWAGGLERYTTPTASHSRSGREGAAGRRQGAQTPSCFIFPTQWLGANVLEISVNFANLVCLLCKIKTIIIMGPASGIWCSINENPAAAAAAVLILGLVLNSAQSDLTCSHLGFPRITISCVHYLVLLLSNILHLCLCGGKEVISRGRRGLL